MLKKTIHENNDKIIIKKKNKIVNEEEFDNLIKNTNNIDLNKKVIYDDKNINDNNNKITTIKKINQQKNKIIDEEDLNNINLNKKVINDYKNINNNNKIIKINIVKSDTAKNGYKEEDNVCNDLNNNVEIKQLFENFIKKKYSITFKKYNGNKCKIDISNDEYIFIQVKKYKKNQFGQLDRHWISDIIKQIPDLKQIEKILIDMCEYPLKKCGKIIDKTKQIKKLNNDNYNNDELINLLNVLNNNKKIILEYVFLGNNNDIPQYICGIECDKNNNRKKMTIYNIQDVIKYLEQYNFIIKKSHTVLQLGNCISFQRKGGDNGDKSSNQLQTKLIFSNIDIKNKLEYFF